MMQGSSRVAGDIRAWWLGLSNGQRFFALALLIAPGVLLLSRDLRNLSLLLVGLPGVWFGFRVGFLRFIGKDGRRWLWLVWGFLAVGVLAWAVNGFPEGGFARLERYDRLLFFLPWLITLLWLRPPCCLLWLSLALGGMSIGIGAGVEVWQSGEGLSYRVEGGTHTMSFGILSAMLAVLLATAAWQFRAHRLLALLLAVGALGAMLAMVFSGVRAGVVGLSAGFLAIIIIFIRYRDWRGAAAFFFTPLAVTVVILLTVGDSVTQRFAEGVSQVRDYFITEAAFPPRAEITDGCQDDIRTLNAMVLSEGVRRDNVGGVAVIPGEAGVPCGEGNRLRIEGNDKDRGQIGFQRDLPRDEPKQAGRVYARGSDARFRVRGGPWISVGEETTALELPADEQWAWSLDVRVASGGWVEFTPYAFWAGEYRYPHTLWSMGQRVEMWRLAWDTFLEQPLFGTGTGSFNQVTTDRADRGLGPRILRDSSHAHNEYLEALATRGIIGLLALILLLAGLLYVSVRPGPGETKCTALAGIPFAGAWSVLVVALLFEASLSMNIVAVTIAYLMALCLYLSGRGTDPEDWTRNRLRFRR